MGHWGCSLGLSWGLEFRILAQCFLVGVEDSMTLDHGAGFQPFGTFGSLDVV